MNGRDRFCDKLKIGISVGTFRGQRQYQTPVEHPAHALHRANEIIHENFDPGFSLFFVDHNERKRRSRRRR